MPKQSTCQQEIGQIASSDGYNKLLSAFISPPRNDNLTTNKKCVLTTQLPLKGSYNYIQLMEIFDVKILSLLYYKIIIYT
jgi:hypothetical protein